MNDRTFGETLRLLRTKSKKSIKEVIEELKNYDINITDKALYSYENDKRAANADTFLALCKIYNCNNVLEMFSNIEVDYSIPSDSEWKIIEMYRFIESKSSELANMIDSVLENSYNTAKKIEEKQNNISEFPQHLMADAANDQNPTEEQKQHVDKIMTDDNEWK